LNRLLDCKIIEAEAAALEIALARNVKGKSLLTDSIDCDGRPSAAAEMMATMLDCYDTVQDFADSVKGVEGTLLFWRFA
jgi:hypothetical protein